MDSREHLQEFLEGKIKYAATWHPTVLAAQARMCDLSAQFNLDNRRHEATVKKLLAYEKAKKQLTYKEMPIDLIKRQYIENPYVWTRTTKSNSTLFLLGEEFTYWAEEKKELYILEATGNMQSSLRIATKCIPVDRPLLSTFRRMPKDILIAYLLGDNDAVSEYLFSTK